MTQGTVHGGERLAVVGAGLIGRLLAFKLQARGHPVTLFEARPETCTGAASFAAAGMLAPTAEAAHAAPEVQRWGARALALWPAILQALPSQVAFTRSGSLVLARDGDDAELAHFATLLSKRATGTAPRILDGEALALLEPGLARLGLRGLLLADEGQIDNVVLMAALKAALLSGGATLRYGEAVQPEPYGVLAGNGRQSFASFAWTFDCRGVGAQAELPTLRGVRGEAILLAAPELRLSRPVRLLHRRYPLYVVPRGGDRFLIGATEIESDSDAPMSLTSALELLSAAYGLSPALHYARVERLITGVRPAFPDHLPRLVNQPGLTRLNGLHRHGYLLAPVVTDAAIDLFLDRPITSDLQPLLRTP